MKIFFRHEYKGYGVHPSACIVHVETINDIHFIIFEDQNEGTSVTNASEQIATEVVRRLKLDPRKCRFFETYPQYESHLDEIFYDWSYRDTIYIATNASWKPFMENIGNVQNIFKNIIQNGTSTKCI